MLGNLPAGAVAGTFSAVIVGASASRLKGHYLAVATLSRQSARTDHTAALARAGSMAASWSAKRSRA